MTGVFTTNVGIIQAFFCTDANSSLSKSMIFVGISIAFKQFDTAYGRLKRDLSLASTVFLAVLMQHRPLDYFATIWFRLERVHNR